MFGNYQSASQQNMSFQQPVGQFGRSNYIPGMGLRQYRYESMIGSQGGFPASPRMGQLLNGFGGGPGTGMPLSAQGISGVNPAWGAGLQSAGGQGFAVPGYPPQGFTQQSMSPAQVYPSQGYSPQGYSPQWYNQGYGGQQPVQPAWEEPKKGGIKGFISNLMAKCKR
jgi:hypothetical protein